MYIYVYMFMYMYVIEDNPLFQSKAMNFAFVKCSGCMVLSVGQCVYNSCLYMYMYTESQQFVLNWDIKDSTCACMMWGRVRVS